METPMRTMIFILLASFSVHAQDGAHYRYEVIKGTEKVIEIPKICMQIPAPGQLGDVSSSGYIYYPYMKVTNEVNAIEQVWVPSTTRAFAFLGMGHWEDDSSAPITTREMASTKLLDGIFFQESEQCTSYVISRGEGLLQ